MSDLYEFVAKFDELSYLFAAFSAVWLVIFLYAVSISRRQRALAKEVQLLRKLLDEQPSRPSR